MSADAIDEIRRRQDQLESDKKELWRVMTQTREDFARVDRHMQDVSEALKDLREENHSAHKEVSQKITDLYNNQKNGTNQRIKDLEEQIAQSRNRVQDLEEEKSQRKGAFKIVITTLSVAIPAFSSIAGAIYYIAQLL